MGTQTLLAPEPTVHFEIPTDVDEIGYSTRLLFAIPLLRALVQMVAESEGDWNFLNFTVASGAWCGVARTANEDFLLISTNHGDRTSERYPAELDEALVGHAFEFDSEFEGYRQTLRFESDEAFSQIARLIIGTFQHAWGANLMEHVRVDLSLPLPPTVAAVA